MQEFLLVLVGSTPPLILLRLVESGRAWAGEGGSEPEEGAATSLAPARSQGGEWQEALEDAVLAAASVFLPKLAPGDVAGRRTRGGRGGAGGRR